MCVREREQNNNFSITAIIFKVSDLQFKKDFKSAELLAKTSFFLYFRDRPQMTKEAKNVECISARLTKHGSKKVAKAEVDLNWSL